MIEEMILTAHFKTQELKVSSLFPNIAATIELTDNDILNYFHLISTTLEPERQFSGDITKILNGKRSDKLHNALKAVEGINPSDTSKHRCKKPFDCAVDFQKIVRRPDGSLNITASRTKTIFAYCWISFCCPNAYGTMYYQEPGDQEKIGYIHIDSIRQGYPVGVCYLKNATEGVTWKK